MAAGFPVKADYASGDVLTAAQMNDLSGTLNYLDPTAKGDLFPASSGTALTRLAVGANDTVLTADSSTATGLKWAAAGSSGGMTLISTTTLSGATTTFSSIPQTYNHLYILVNGVTANTSNSRIRCLPNNVDNLSNASVNDAINGGVVYQTNKAILLTDSFHLRTDADNSFAFQIDNYASSTTYKPFNFYGFYVVQSGTGSSIISSGAFRSNTAITSLVFDYGGTNTFAGGTVSLYGVK